jgi:hypothetical protein
MVQVNAKIEINLMLESSIVKIQQGGLAFPHECWPCEAHDVTLVTLDVTQRQMDMMEAVVCQVA